MCVLYFSSKNHECDDVKHQAFVRSFNSIDSKVHSYYLQAILIYMYSVIYSASQCKMIFNLWVYFYSWNFLSILCYFERCFCYVFVWKRINRLLRGMKINLPDCHFFSCWNSWFRTRNFSSKQQHNDSIFSNLIICYQSLGFRLWWFVVTTHNNSQRTDTHTEVNSLSQEKLSWLE